MDDFARYIPQPSVARGGLTGLEGSHVPLTMSASVHWSFAAVANDENR